MLGMDGRRLPPAFARRSLTAQARGQRSWQGSAGKPARTVVLFPDTFTEHYEPDVGLAAIDLLRAAGSHVWLGPRRKLRWSAMAVPLHGSMRHCANWSGGANRQGAASTTCVWRLIAFWPKCASVGLAEMH